MKIVSIVPLYCGCPAHEDGEEVPISHAVTLEDGSFTLLCGECVGYLSLDDEVKRA